MFNASIRLLSKSVSTSPSITAIFKPSDFKTGTTDSSKEVFPDPGELKKFITKAFPNKALFFLAIISLDSNAFSLTAKDLPAVPVLPECLPPPLPNAPMPVPELPLFTPL